MTSPSSPPPPVFSRLGNTAKAMFRELRRVLKPAALTCYWYLRQLATYYWSHRKAFRQYLYEYFPDLQSPQIRVREIRICATEQLIAARRTRNAWTVELPDCCVVCGEAPDGEWTEEARSVEDLGKPFWSPLVGFGASVLLWLILWPFWCVAVGTLAGFLVGYWLRREIPVEIRFRHCDRHAAQIRWPRLRIFGDQLIVRVGNKLVRHAFLQREQGLTWGWGKDDSTDHPVPDPPPIPLADQVTGEIRHEQTIRLATASSVSDQVEKPGDFSPPPQAGRSQKRVLTSSPARTKDGALDDRREGHDPSPITEQQSKTLVPHSAEAPAETIPLAGTTESSNLESQENDLFSGLDDLVQHEQEGIQMAIPIEIKCQCGKTYAVPQKFAGRRAKCKSCGRPIAVPQTPSQHKDTEDGFLHVLNEAITEAKQAPSVKICPSCNKPLASGAVLCVECGYHLKTGKHRAAAPVRKDTVASDTRDLTRAKRGSFCIDCGVKLTRLNRAIFTQQCNACWKSDSKREEEQVQAVEAMGGCVAFLIAAVVAMVAVPGAEVLFGLDLSVGVRTALVIFVGAAIWQALGGR